jgi:hypothetical protein
MEACGCSDVGAIISAVHKVFTTENLYWNYEISRLHAIDPKYKFPKGASSVYYVNPLDLIKRGYDKIIILRREKEDIIEDLCTRNNIMKDEYDKYPEFFDKIDFYYDLIYEQEGITDSKQVFKIHLQDLNNYCVAAYSELLDFLEYPKGGRPVLIPVPTPLRDWKKFSSVLKLGHEDERVHKTQYTQYVNEEKPNAYKLSPEEYYYQKGMVYRIKPEPMVDVLEVLKLL